MKYITAFKGTSDITHHTRTVIPSFASGSLYFSIPDPSPLDYVSSRLIKSGPGPRNDEINDYVDLGTSTRYQHEPLTTHTRVFPPFYSCSDNLLFTERYRHPIKILRLQDMTTFCLSSKSRMSRSKTHWCLDKLWQSSPIRLMGCKARSVWKAIELSPIGT